MATRTWIVNPQSNGRNYFTLNAPLAATDVTEGLEIGGSAGLAGALTLSGTFGGSVAIEGSNDDTTWATLKDSQGYNLTTTAATGFEFSTAFKKIRLNAGAGVTAVVPVLTLRG